MARHVMRGPAGLATIAVALIAALTPAVGSAQPGSAADSSFQAFLPTYEAAIRSFFEGDNTAWKELLSTEPGGTLCTPFGEVVQGASALRERYDWVVTQYEPVRPARVEVEYVTIDASGDLAYFVALERGTYRVAGTDSTRSGLTRATMVFRREVGGWKLRHRHMDNLGAAE